MKKILIAVIFVVLIGSSLSAECNCPFPGDSNGSDEITISDLVYVVNFIFVGGPVTVKDTDCPVSRGDYDCSENYDMTDLIATVNYLFHNGQPPCNPCL